MSDFVKSYTNGNFTIAPDNGYKRIIVPGQMPQQVPRWMIPGAITSEIFRLADVTLTEISNLEGKDIDEYIKYVTKEPVARQCINLKAMRAAVTFGRYEHDNKEIQEFVQTMFDEMDGGLEKVVGQMASAMPFGYSCCEIVWLYMKPIRKWVIKKFVFLDPRRVMFKGGKGRIEYLIYRDRTRKYVPYYKILHTVNGNALDFNDPFGIPEAKSALPYIKFKNSILSDMLIAGKNLATGILVGKVNSTKPVNVYNNDGTPKQVNGANQKLTAAQAMAMQFNNLENNSYLVTDIENEVQSLQVGDGSQFWQYSLNLVDNYIKSAFNVPQMMFTGQSQTMGPGGATISNQQMNIMDASIGAIVQQLQEQMIEKAIRPLIDVNFGPQKDYGKFVPGKHEDPNIEMNRLGQLISAVSMGILSADDMEVQNKIRHLLELPKISMKEKMAQLQLQMQLQSMQTQQQGQDQAQTQVDQAHIMQEAGMMPEQDEAQGQQQQQTAQKKQSSTGSGDQKKQGGQDSAAKRNQPGNTEYP